MEKGVIEDVEIIDWQRTWTTGFDGDEMSGRKIVGIRKKICIYIYIYKAFCV